LWKYGFDLREQSSEGSGLGSAVEMFLEVVLSEVVEDLLHVSEVVDHGLHLRVESAAFVQGTAVSPASQGEVSNGGFVSNEVVLAGVGSDSLVEGVEASGENVGEVVLSSGLPLLFVRLKEEFVLPVLEIVDGVDSGVDLVGCGGVLAVVPVLLAEESEDGGGLGVEVAFLFEGGDLSEFEVAGFLGGFPGFLGVPDVFVVDFCVVE